MCPTLVRRFFIGYLNSYNTKLFTFSEPFLEATPQVYITLILMDQTSIDLNNKTVLYASFILSILSATFGIAKLLKNGPIKMVRMKGKLGGYGTPGFILLMGVVAGNMIGKSLWMSFTLDRQDISGILIWALTCNLLQLILVKSLINCLFKDVRK